VSAGHELVIVGGGEHARVVIDAARSRTAAWTILGYSDPTPNEETTARFGLAHLGTDDEVIARFAGRGVFHVLGVGTVGVVSRRAQIAERFERAGARFAAVIHAAACVSPSAHVEGGAVIMAGAIVNTGARVGAHAIVNTGAVVEHDVTLGAHTSVGPAAAVGGGAAIGERSYLGLGCRVRDHVRIGARALVGMGAVVVGNAEDDVVLVGVPARPMRTRAA
jgi:acetyltransferase EpsM